MRTNITIIVLVLLLCASALAQSQEVLHHFSETDGERPRGTLLKFNGYIYGVTAQGGEYGHGTIYRIKPQGGEFEVIHDFDDANGNYPNYGGVITDGRYLYGLTSRGGPDDDGVFFRINPDGSDFMALHYFQKPGGANPYGGLFLFDDQFYFHTSDGGVEDNGTFSKINKDGSGYQVLYSFAGGTTSIDNCWGNLAWDGERFYCSASDDALYDEGAVWAINRDGSGFEILHNFASGEGEPVYNSPILIGEYLYGMTGEGGVNNLGRMYKIKTDGSDYQIIDDSLNGEFGYYQAGSLIFEKGRLYCVASRGGENGDGAIFRIDRSGNNFELLHTLLSSVDGSRSRGTPLISGGFLYGTGYSGGTSGQGTIFRIPLAGHVTTLIYPREAKLEGAQWRLDFQADWRNSGDTARDLPYGDYTIRFKPVKGWVKPADQKISVGHNAFVTVKGTYTREQHLGHLKVIVKPNYARKNDAQWTVVGSGKWYSSGERIQLPVNNVRIKFGRLKGYSRPAPFSISIVENTTSVVKKSYIEK